MTITLEKVNWGIGGQLLVDGVSLEAVPGETLGLIGPNGSGKSSLLRLICRLRKVASGVITLGQTDLAVMPRAEIARRIALVEQQATTETDITVLEVVRLGRTPHLGPLSPWSNDDEMRVTNALAHVGMTEKRRQLWHTLSGGERQRVHIARALAQAPSELLLDEPTNHLDIQHQLEILSLVAKLPATTIVALHDLNLAAMFCDRILVLDHGRAVMLGTPAEVLTEPLLERVFKVRTRVLASPYHTGPHVHFLVD